MKIALHLTEAGAPEKWSLDVDRKELDAIYIALESLASQGWDETLNAKLRGMAWTIARQLGGGRLT